MAGRFSSIVGTAVWVVLITSERNYLDSPDIIVFSTKMRAEAYAQSVHAQDPDLSATVERCEVVKEVRPSA